MGKLQFQVCGSLPGPLSCFATESPVIHGMAAFTCTEHSNDSYGLLEM